MSGEICFSPASASAYLWGKFAAAELVTDTWLLRPFLQVFYMLLKSATAKFKWAWQSRFPLNPQGPSAGSWLQARKSPWGVGCEACHGCRCKSSFASFEVQ